MDPYHQLVAVSSIAPLRDLAPNTIPSMLSTLSEWSTRCTTTLADLEKQIAAIKASAKARHKEEEEWAATVENLISSKAEEGENKKGKGKDKSFDGDKAPGGGFGGGLMGEGGLFAKMGTRLGGNASKRGVDEDEAMEIDDEEEDVERRGSRSKKRGFGLLGGK